MAATIIRRAGIIASGTITAQIAGLLVLPILSRLYSPEDMGYFGVYTSFLYIAISFVSLRYEVSIVQARNIVEIVNISTISVIITAIFSLLSFVFIFFILDINNEYQFLRLLPISIFFLGISNILLYINLRYENLKIIATVNIIQVFVTIAIQLYPLVGFHDPEILMYSQIIGIIVNVIISSYYLRFYKINILNYIKLKYMNYILKKYKRYPLYDAPSTFINILNNNLISIVFGLVFDAYSAGLVTFVTKVVSTPIGVLTNAITLSVLSGDRRSGLKSMNFLDTGAMKKINIILPLISIVAVFSMAIFEPVFGPKWSDGIRTIGWIVFLVGFKAIYDCLQPFNIINSMQIKNLSMQIILLLRWPAIPIVGNLYGFDVAIVTFSIASVVIYYLGIVNFFHVNKIIKNKIHINGLLVILISVLFILLAQDIFNKNLIYNLLYFFISFVIIIISTIRFKKCRY